MALKEKMAVITWYADVDAIFALSAVPTIAIIQRIVETVDPDASITG
jgi:hypothetical protein